MAIIKSGATPDQWTVDPTSNAGRVTLYDPAGHPIESVLGADGLYYQAVAMQQEVLASTKNSSTGQIGTGSYWEGQVESTLGVAGIQINTYLNRAHRVTIYQGMDISNFDISDYWDEPANYGTARTVQATAAYYKVRVTNISGSPATVVRIQTALCPTVEALPRALTIGGNLRVSVAPDWQSTRRVTGLYTVCSPRTIGLASAPQNLFVIQNPAASLYWVAIRSLNISTDSTAALATISPLIRVSRGTTVSGGTSWTANIAKYQTSFPSPQATCLADTNADDAALTTIVATAGVTIWQQEVDRIQATNQVGQIVHTNYNLIPDVGTDLRQIILVPGENLLIQVVVTAAAATTVFLINASWSEMLSL